MYKIDVPRINSNDDFCDLVQIHFDKMAAVAEGDLLVSLETTKAVEEVYSPASGFVLCSHQVGDRLVVGSHLLTVCSSADDIVEPVMETIGEQSSESSGDLILSDKVKGLLKSGEVSIDELKKIGKKHIKLSDLAKKTSGDNDTISGTEDQMIFPKIDGYIEPPVAYFYCDFPDRQLGDVEFEIHCALRNQSKSGWIGGYLIRNEGKLLLCPIPAGDERVQFKAELTRSIVDSFSESEPQPFGVDYVISSMSSNSIGFSHQALLWPGSKLTFALADSVEGVRCCITYDHRYWSGHLALELMETVTEKLS